jgi:plasmid replication initiation protein
MADGLSQLDLFHLQAGDPPIRDYRDCMIYPFVSLQKNRTEPIDFSAFTKGGRVWVKVQALSGFYVASIWDWDFLLGVTAHLNDAVERNLPTTNDISFAPHTVLTTMKRGTSGREYQNLAHTIRRLHATHVFTNIRDFDQPSGEEGGFNWITSFKIPKRYSETASITEASPEGVADPSRPWRVTLQPWLYKALERRSEILAVHPAYFELTGGIERWLYRLARKAVPDNNDVPAITFPVGMLYKHAGVTGSLKKFTAKLRKVEQEDPLPEYGIAVNRDPDNTSVTLFRKTAHIPRTRRGVYGTAQAVADHRETRDFKARFENQT